MGCEFFDGACHEDLCSKSDGMSLRKSRMRLAILRGRLVPWGAEHVGSLGISKVMLGHPSGAAGNPNRYLATFWELMIPRELLVP